MKQWAQRVVELRAELAAIADIDIDPRWWLVAGAAAAAEPLPARASYVISDAEPDGDTFIGHRKDEPLDQIADAIAYAHATRTAIRELDGQLPEQPLALTIQRGAAGARAVPSTLDVAAFAIGDVVVLAQLADAIEDEAPLAKHLAAVARSSPSSLHPVARRFDRSLAVRPPLVAVPVLTAPAIAALGSAGPTSQASHVAPIATATAQVVGAIVPFVGISIGEERMSAARHGHRRAWRDGAGPWLGIGRVGGLVTFSTCHMVVDGYGHTWLAATIAEHHARFIRRAPAAPIIDPPHLSLVAEAIPLGVAWRELPSPAPRAIPLAYALGRVLHRLAGDPHARFSPTFQIPIAPGQPDDPDRKKRRVVPSIVSVRFEDGEPESFGAFEARVKATLTREANGRGLLARLLTAARAVPVPLAWKRRSFTTARPKWLERIADIVGGRACLSRISLDVPVPFSCAVSSPARRESASDPLGGCVITIVDDDTHAAITACGSGLAGNPDDAADLIDAVLELV